MLSNISKIYYPRYEKLIKENSISYQFELENNNLQLDYEVYSSDYFLELNSKNELIARTGSNTINIYKNQNPNDEKSFTYSEKIVQCFTLSNGSYLLSTQDKNGIHTLVLVGEDLKILKEQKVGLTSWHSQSSIAEANGVIIYGEYNVAKHPTKVSLYRSKDMGYSWEEVFVLNAPDEMRHWHTLQYDEYNNSWLATSGDTPQQSRWFISKDDGKNWNEITDKKFIEKINREKSLSAHRTTYVNIEKDKYLWATDDLMGNVRDFFILENGERKTASKLYMSKKTKPLKVQKLTPLGIHIRSMIDIGSGYILFSEGKYVTYNTQVFYIDKNDLTKPYYLFSLYSNSGHGGTYSINSSVVDGIFFIKHKIEKGFGTLKFNIKTLTKKTLQYSIENYLKLEEHLWFLNKVNSIKNIIFSKDSVKLNLSEKKEVFYMLLGDEKVDSFKSKKLFKVSKKQFGISVDMKKNKNFTSVKMYVQFFNDEKKISSKSYILNKGSNVVFIDRNNEEEQYLRVLFRIEHNQMDEIVLSNLSLIDNVDKSKVIPETGSLQKKSLPDLNFRKETNLLDTNLVYNEYIQYSFLVENLQTDILTHFKKSDKLVVFYNGAVDVEKTPPPVFQRWSWLEDLPYSAMVIMDSTIYELMKTNKSTTYMGWYQGSKEIFILEQYIELVRKIANKLGVKDENILFYGSSVGGFASLMSAGMLKGSKACVVNPQTDVLKYYKKNVDVCLNYLGLSNEYLKDRKTTLNVMEFYKSIGYFPEVYYKQNKQDELHYEKHFKEFQKLYKDNNLDDRLFVNLTDDSRGHSAIPRYDEGYGDILRAFNGNKTLSIKKTSQLDIKLFSLKNNDLSTINIFKPRSDVKEYKLNYPLNWAINPFEDRNWCFQLHAWRMLDIALLKYNQTKKVIDLIECLKVIEDWKQFTFDRNQVTDFTWYDMATGLRALKIAFIAIEVFNVDQNIQFEPYKELIYFLMNEHIKILKTQKIANDNHGIFQLHGLAMLCWLKNDNDGLEYALKNMNILFKKQFYEDGFQVENSDEYHWFTYDVFKDVLSFEIYSNLKNRLKVAEKRKFWTVFPDKVALSIGDSSYTKRNNFPIEKFKENYELCFFKDSGYLFVRSHPKIEKNQASMLFFNTAYKHKSHRHSDDFNILLYEYGLNILVDSGKYSYDHNCEERKYVVSTRAHNCVVIDNINYEYKGKYFYNSALKTFRQENDMFYIKANIFRKDTSTLHTRSIFYKARTFLIVVDELESDKERNFSQVWHFNEKLDLKLIDNIVSSQIDNHIEVQVELSSINLDRNIEEKNIRVIKGQYKPYMQGFRSLKYNELIENFAVENSVKAKKAMIISKFIFVKDKISPSIDLEHLIFRDSILSKADKNILGSDLIYHNIKFEEHLWFLNKTNTIDDVSFFGNGVKLFLNAKKEPFYLLLDNPKVDLLLAKELFKIDTTKGGIRVNLATMIDKNQSLKMYIQFFDDNEKVFSQSYVMKNGFNSVEVDILEDFKYFRVLFRIENKLEKKSIVELTDLDFQYINKNKVEITSKNNIQNFTKQDSSISLIFLQKNASTFKSFKPREDTKKYSLSFPLEWSIDPYSDRNWCFQLSAWRMMDPLLLEYSKSKKLELLKQCLVIMDDWKIYTFDQNKETHFTWYDMATGLRALKLTYFANIIFNTSLENQIQDKTKENILFLLKEHIKVLKTQSIAMNNHGLFQLHGLIMASSLLKDKKGVEYGFEKINLLIDSQFYPDGFHVENSDKYHGFVLDIFKRIVKFSEYKNNKKLIDIIDKALYTWKLTVFPNLEPLLIGDTDYKIRNIEFDKDTPNQYFMKYFQDSGYVFVRSTFSTKAEDASMLFFQTAYKNMTHRHSDDFNILLYEYGKNILVDAGQHSYDYSSKEREYVLSTRAHNTILIDNHNYDRENKLFYSSVLKQHKEENGIFILQTTLERKDIDVAHNRNIVYKPKEFLIVIDKLTSKQEREYAQNWHFHQNLKVVQDGEAFISNIDENNSMKIECSVFNFYGVMKKVKQNNIDTQLYEGQTKAELQGWRSLKYRKLIENYALRNSISSKNAILMTKFLFNNNSLEITNVTSDTIEIKDLNIIVDI